MRHRLTRPASVTAGTSFSYAGRIRIRTGGLSALFFWESGCPRRHLLRRHLLPPRLAVAVAAGGGSRTRAPSAPRNLMAVGGDGQVVLTWDAPVRDGGAAISDYEYRIDRMNAWISTGSTNTTHTVSGLDNGTSYVFEVRAVNRRGMSFPSNRIEATPEAPEPEVSTLDFAHFANGEGITSDVVLLNVGTTAIQPVLYFFDRQGEPLDADSVVDMTEDLEVQDDGGLTVQTAMEPLGELTIATHGRGEEVRRIGASGLGGRHRRGAAL